MQRLNAGAVLATSPARTLGGIPNVYADRCSALPRAVRGAEAGAVPVPSRAARQGCRSSLRFPSASGAVTMTTDAYSEVTDRIVAALDAGTVPWRRPWVASAESHRNPVCARGARRRARRSDDRRTGRYRTADRSVRGLHRGMASRTEGRSQNARVGRGPRSARRGLRSRRVARLMFSPRVRSQIGARHCPNQSCARRWLAASPGA